MLETRSSVLQWLISHTNKQLTTYKLAYLVPGQAQNFFRWAMEKPTFSVCMRGRWGHSRGESRRSCAARAVRECLRALPILCADAKLDMRTKRGLGSAPRSGEHSSSKLRSGQRVLGRAQEESLTRGSGSAAAEDDHQLPPHTNTQTHILASLISNKGWCLACGWELHPGIPMVSQPLC